MEPEMIVWIVALFGGSAVAKFLALLPFGKHMGMVSAPLAGIVGGLGLWQGLAAIGAIDTLDYVAAGVTSVIGGAVVFLVFAMMTRKAA